jgi:transposase-like protein
MNNIARKEVIDQVRFVCPLDEEPTSRFNSVTEFLDHVEVGFREFVRQIAQEYAEDELPRFIGAKRYERTPVRKDRRNESRPKKLETRLGLIEALCAAGITEKEDREHLGLIQSHQESQKAWESLLTHLVGRGLDPKGFLMLRSDGCPGIVWAIRTVLP